MNPEVVHCPVCGRDQPAVARYPDYLCASCAARALSEDGRPLAFYNVSISGGFVAKYADTDELADEPTITHIAYVDGLRCWADEARFGGIVLRPWPEGSGALGPDRPDRPDRPDAGGSPS
ncbi:MAG: hypothetical protein ACXVEU_13805 [Nocardioidaceae bacterium]